MTYFKKKFSGNVDNLFDYKNIENDGIDYDESTINSSLDSGTLSSKSSGKLDLDFFLEIYQYKKSGFQQSCLFQVL